ncbi:MAG: MotA/TolQ/ExbB proton channel family protein [Gammaproteobacteria bacterium]|nr:MotA/TolQ/ExbB proton channel family protein [Gammaproteobacteria bacterium]
MDSVTTVIRFFQEGGIFMYPIMLILAGGLAIAIERYVFLWQARRVNLAYWQRVYPLLNDARFNEAQELSMSGVALSHVVNYGLRRLRANGNALDVEAALQEGLMEVMPSIEKRTHYLATFANVATLLGLLGTIIGLIEAFTAVAHADPAQKADLLSSSISVAMNTTAFGLIVAIPLVLIYTMLQAKTTEIIDGIETSAVKFVNLVATRQSK